MGGDAEPIGMVSRRVVDGLAQFVDLGPVTTADEDLCVGVRHLEEPRYRTGIGGALRNAVKAPLSEATKPIGDGQIHKGQPGAIANDAFHKVDAALLKPRWAGPASVYAHRTVTWLPTAAHATTPRRSL